MRNVRIVAERPNGLRVPFMSCPTPLTDVNGKLIGAFDMLVPIRTVPKWFAEWRVNHRGPDEPDELARDRGRRDRRAFPVLGQHTVAHEQSRLRVPRAGGDLGWDLAGESGGAGGLARAVLILPGRFDQ